MMNLRIPGPTPLPPEVLKAISRQMINHRGHEYEAMQPRIIEALKHFFQTKNDIFLLTDSGTGGMEAAITNFFSPGDRMLFFTCGAFGNRWADAARAFGGHVIQEKLPQGQGFTKDHVERVVKREKNVKGIFITHNETSSGVLNSLHEIIVAIKALRAGAGLRPGPKRFGTGLKPVPAQTSCPLILVDAVSSLGAVDLPIDRLGIDVVVTASQKAWMAPPGMCMISVSEKAWEYHKTAKMPRYYFDITLLKKFAEKNQTPATPAVSVMFGLEAALKLMKKEGRASIFKRHLMLMKHFRKEARRIGLELLVDDQFASPTVTSIKVPQSVILASEERARPESTESHGKEWMQILEKKHNLIIAGGMEELKGKIIRVAHMGYVTKTDLDATITALEQSI